MILAKQPPSVLGRRFVFDVSKTCIHPLEKRPKDPENRDSSLASIVRLKLAKAPAQINRLKTTPIPDKDSSGELLQAYEPESRRDIEEKQLCCITLRGALYDVARVYASR